MDVSTLQQTGKLTLQSDVYAFGVVLLELLTGRRAVDTMESIAMFANLASRCIRIDSQERPSMTECVKELQLILYINSKGLGQTMHTLRML